jgi:hypothetical protein
MSEFVRRDRGICVSVKERNDGLLWVTIEGTTGLEVQIWLSAFGLPETRTQEFCCTMENTDRGAWWADSGRVRKMRRRCAEPESTVRNKTFAMAQFC